MARYDEIFQTLVERAISQGGIDVETFMRRAIQSGMSEDVLMSLLEEDLLNDGPIFGKYVRSMVGAARSSVMAAERQGETISYLVSDPEVRELLRDLDIEEVAESALANADPELSEQVEAAVAGNVEYTWIATLMKTCHVCLPLHGQTRSMLEWREMGKTPDTVHQLQGWDSTCKCRLVPVSTAESQSELQEPLFREKLQTATGLKGSKKTRRRVSQMNLDKSEEAVNDAMKTSEGRRTVRIMGQANRETNDG